MAKKRKARKTKSGRRSVESVGVYWVFQFPSLVKGSHHTGPHCDALQRSIAYSDVVEIGRQK